MADKDAELLREVREALKSFDDGRPDDPDAWADMLFASMLEAANRKGFRLVTVAESMTLDEAKEYLADEIQPNGNLYDLGWYLSFVVGDERAVLDGGFSADDLEAIAAYMRAHQPKDSPNG